MKGLIIFCILVIGSGLACFSQQANTSFPNDTLKGAQTDYTNSPNKSMLYRGLVTFQFTAAHDVGTIYLEGNNVGSVWYPVDTISHSGATAVNYRFTVIDPEFVYYRLRKVGNGGDTCYITNQRFILKY
jgi:hypothetical protein